MADLTPYQQKVVKRYYDNQDHLAEQRLAELVTELYLAEGKKRDRLWERAAQAMQKLGIPQSRIDNILTNRDPVLLAGIVEELHGRG
jgi:hypothetical protein